MDSIPPLDSRKQQILKAVVFDYTETGIPVGSQALAAKYLVSWSSATIRNELANLVDIGYLLQPHTSAGRVPSDRGYRYYVDFLMEEEDVPATVRRLVDPRLPQHPGSLDELLEAGAMVLAVITGAVSIVTGPRTMSARLKHLDVVSLDARTALLVVLLEGNLLRQQVVRLGVEADQERLSVLSGTLNGELAGLDAAAVEALPPLPYVGDDTLRTEVLAHLVVLMRSAAQTQDAVVLHDGVRNLLHQPEFGDVQRLEEVLGLLEEERVLGGLLTQLDIGRKLQIVIGAENEVEALRTCSLVLTTYGAGPGRRGTIGVLGPTRMRYPQVAPRLRYLSTRLGHAVDRLLG